MRFLSVPVVILGCLAGGLFTGGCASDRGVVSQAGQFHDTLKPAVMDDAKLAGYIQQIGDRIIAAARQLDAEKAGPPSHFNADSAWMFSKDMQFHFVNSKTLNAFTTGGNHMYVYNELFQQARSEDELAAVMAHEFAHVYCRHVQKGMNRQYGLMGAAAVAGGAGYLYGGEEKGGQYAGTAAGAALLVGQFVGMSYTRDDEAQADEYGFAFYVRAGWDPAKFDDFFQHMIDGGYDKGPELLSDHPSLQSRVDVAKKRVAELPPADRKYRKAPVASAAEFRQYQAYAQQVAAHTPSDETLAKTQTLLAAMNRSCLTPAIQADQKQAELVVAADKKKLEQK